jgi:dipeptidyl aminopeptidase/acylaminoacyl peptidase
MGAACALAMGLPAAAQAADGTAADQMLARYQRAAEIEMAHTHHWILNETVAPHWIAGRDAFWYAEETAQGHRYLIMDATTGAKTDAFDQARLATELGKAVGRTVDANDLPIKAEWLDPAAGTVRFFAFDKTWLFDSVKGLSEEPEPRSHFTVSPDGKLGVISKDHNLWLKDFASGKETQLTTDGEERYEYGVPPEALHHPAFSPEVIWSPDSRRIFTAQTDDRQVLDLPVVEFAPKDGVRSHVVNYHAALPGDVNVPMFRLTVIDVTNGHQTPVRYETIPAVRMNDSPMDGKRMWWSGDSKHAYFVDIERGEKAVHVEAVDADTGATRELFSETSDTYVELGSDVYEPAALRPLPNANQLIWYSERSGWAHLYLYDLNTGKLIRPLTSGDWLVRDVLGVDEAHRQVFVSIAGRTPGKNPYYQETARIDLDTGAMKVLTASDDDHEVLVPGGLVNANALVYLFSGGDPHGLSGVAPSGDYFVETVTRADKPSRSILYDRDGRVVATVEDADASRLPSWYRWPTPVKLTAADGKTEIDGLVFRPSDYDPHKKYPVIDLVYGGPQAAYVPKSFDNFAYQGMASLAELGFVVTSIDGRGTVQRSRAFHAASYRKAETASDLEDHIAGIKQLAAADPGMDLSRVGITGFSGGGYMTAIGMFRFPDFYKVGVAGSGNYDQSLFWATWGERYEGYPYGDYYKQQDAKTYVAGLKGKLLIVQGLMDVGVTPAGTFQLEQALQDANKDYDTLLWPRLTHDISAYGKRREWDYFVRYLAGETPPHEFLLNDDEDIEKAKAEALEAKPDAKADAAKAEVPAKDAKPDASKKPGASQKDTGSK